VLALSLALHLAVAAPSPLAPSPGPSPDPGPFASGELIASGFGALGGDLVVVGVAYGTLRLFASDVIYPSAHNFRNAAFVLAGTALIVPPLTAALFGRLARASPASGSFWRAFGLATAGQAAALAVTYLAAPYYWVFLPLQLVALAAGTSVGLHWGPRAQAAASDAPPHLERPAATSRPLASIEFPICPDG
jgi:hypothetical protein